MRLLWFLIIAFLVLSIVTAVISFLVQHFGNLSIWNSQTWKTWKIPIIIFIVILGMALLLVANSRSSKKAERARKEFALTQGWGYSIKYDDTEGAIQKVTAILERMVPEKEFDVRTVVTVKQGKENIYLIDCYYNQREGGKESRHGSACLIESERFPGTGSQVNIVARSVLDAALLSKQIKMDNPEFDKSFIVWSKDAAARRVISESVQTMLLEQKNTSPPDITGLEIIFGTGGAVILIWAKVLPEEWQPLVDMARRLESAVR